MEQVVEKDYISQGKNKKKNRLWLVGGFLLIAAAIVAVVTFFLLKQDKMMKFPNFMVEIPRGISKADVQNEAGYADLYIGENKAGGVQVVNYNTSDSDGIPIANSSVESGERETVDGYVLPAIKVTVENLSPPEGASQSPYLENHIFLLSNDKSKVYDLYEVQGVAPEGMADEMAKSFLLQTSTPELEEGWTKVKVDYPALKELQAIADKAVSPWQANPGNVVMTYAIKNLNCNTASKMLEYKPFYENGKMLYYTYSVLRDDGVLISFRLFQPIAQGQKGIWTIYGYREDKADSSSPVLPKPEYETAKDTTAFNVYGSSGIEESSAVKLDEFIQAMKAGTPAEADVLTFNHYSSGLYSISQWVHLSFDGAAATKYLCGQQTDGTYRYYKPETFISITSNVSGTNIFYYTIANEDDRAGSPLLAVAN